MESTPQENKLFIKILDLAKLGTRISITYNTVHNQYVIEYYIRQGTIQATKSMSFHKDVVTHVEPGVLESELLRRFTIIEEDIKAGLSNGPGKK